MSLGDILDAVLLDRFESASHRARALLSVNSRYAHLWGLEDWTFKFATINPTVTGGTQVAGGLPDDFGVPIYLWDEDGSTLSYLNTDVFYNTYLPDTAGSPEAWTVTDQQILLGPLPDHSATYTLHYRKRLTPLVSEGEVPDWPAALKPSCTFCMSRSCASIASSSLLMPSALSPNTCIRTNAMALSRSCCWRFSISIKMAISRSSSSWLRGS